MNYKRDKYINKYNTSILNKYTSSLYLYKLSKHLILSQSGQSGGKIIEFNKNTTGDIATNYEGLRKLIEENVIDKLSHKTTNKYLVILIGPPGSGKSIARKIVTNMIGKMESNTNFDEIFNTFVDVSADDYIYGAKIDGKESGSKLLKDNYDAVQRTYPDSTSKEFIDNLTTSSTKIYFDTRRELDSIGSMMLFIASYLKLNIFIEIVGNTINYINYLINDFCDYHKYIPIIIYPNISNFDLHKERILLRAAKEGRLPSLDYVKYIKTQVDTIFDQIYDSSNSYLKSNIKSLSLVKYNNDKQLNQTDIDAYNFTHLEIIKGKTVTLMETKIDIV
jgi:hypothetical protein